MLLADPSNSMAPMPRRTILHVEDSDDDAFLFDRALSRAQLVAQLQRVQDGRQAVDYLKGVGSYADRSLFPLPELMLLDLKLPQMDGFEVLAWARSQPGFADLPVFVLSSSDLPEDILRARELGAQAYFVKSAKFQDVVAEVSRQLNGKPCGCGPQQHQSG